MNYVVFHTENVINDRASREAVVDSYLNLIQILLWGCLQQVSSPVWTPLPQLEIEMKEFLLSFLSAFETWH